MKETHRKSSGVISHTAAVPASGTNSRYGRSASRLKNVAVVVTVALNQEHFTTNGKVLDNSLSGKFSRVENVSHSSTA